MVFWPLECALPSSLQCTLLVIASQTQKPVRKKIHLTTQRVHIRILSGLSPNPSKGNDFVTRTPDVRYMDPDSLVLDGPWALIRAVSRITGVDRSPNLQIATGDAAQ